jgi:1,4-dihydroxy-2-naphthoyl-CoA hydrolase
LVDFIRNIPFASTLGIELASAEPAEVRGRMAWAEERCTAAGTLHGGALMGFADTLGAICAFLNLPEGTTTATVESKTNFFRPVREGHVNGASRPLHVGRTFIVVQTELLDDDERAVGVVTQTQAVLRKEVS